MNEDDNEMSRMEVLRAQFFTPESEMPPPPQPKARKPRKKRDPGLAALARFARALKAEHPDAQRAAILWLADRFLGMKPRHWL
jgi:hypothetical protein